MLYHGTVFTQASMWFINVSNGDGTFGVTPTLDWFIHSDVSNASSPVTRSFALAIVPNGSSVDDVLSVPRASFSITNPQAPSPTVPTAATASISSLLNSDSIATNSINTMSFVSLSDSNASIDLSSFDPSISNINSNSEITPTNSSPDLTLSPTNSIDLTSKSNGNSTITLIEKESGNGGLSTAGKIAVAIGSSIFIILLLLLIIILLKRRKKNILHKKNLNDTAFGEGAAAAVPIDSGSSYQNSSKSMLLYNVQTDKSKSDPVLANGQQSRFADDKLYNHVISDLPKAYSDFPRSTRSVSLHSRIHSIDPNTSAPITQKTNLSGVDQGPINPLSNIDAHAISQGFRDALNKSLALSSDDELDKNNPEPRSSKDFDDSWRHEVALNRLNRTLEEDDSILKIMPQRSLTAFSTPPLNQSSSSVPRNEDSP
ncbi:hypothetical protein AYI70_g3566 [Smittium culicis]|uniref:Uncharacterized protein n=1 Tax=Smittium culicis TaxID=133412 RepID=A0A1R1Y3H6_9FUNG|nr:hypothetical protein AYI70_g3566 [Smittium culicis]